MQALYVGAGRPTGPVPGDSVTGVEIVPVIQI